MDSNDLSVLIGRLERESDLSPQWYTCKVALVAALGFLPLAIFALLAVGGLGALAYSLITEGSAPLIATACFAIGAAASIFIVRSLAIRLEPPLGRPITREQAPALFETIDDVQHRMALGKRSLSSVSVDSVAIDTAFQAGLNLLPQWGVFGRAGHHLQLGVPLMAGLNVAELKAVIAHEFAHLGSDSQKFPAWIYRQRTAWQAVQQKFASPAALADRMLASFYEWYAIYFIAFTLPLARKHELSADRAAAKATHPGALAHALTKIALMGRYLDEIYWNKLLEQVEHHPQPQYPPYTMMPRALGLAQKQWSRQDWLDVSLRKFPAEGDTHPSLGERFAALNIQPAPPPYSADRTALSLFGGASNAVLQWCDKEWSNENAVAWRQRHDAIKELRWKIAEYEKSPSESLSPEDLWQKVQLIIELGQHANAIEHLQLLVSRQPNMAKAHLLLGKLLLSHGNEQGLQSLTLAAQYDAAVLEDASSVGFGYLMERGRKTEAQRFWDRIQAA